MPYDALLITCSFLIFVIGAWSLLRAGDDLFLVLFLSLFVYTIFTQIGYSQFPELAEAINVYCGPSALFTYWWFIDLSLVLILIGAHFRRKFLDDIWTWRLPRWTFASHGLRQKLFFSLAAAYIIGLAVEVYQNFDVIGYARIEKPVLMFFIFRQPMMAVVLYAKWRRWSANRIERLLSAAMFFVLTAIFFTVAVRAGQRLVVWCYFTGIIVFDLFPLRQRISSKIRRLVVYAIVALGLLHFSNKVVEARSHTDINVAQFAASLFQKTEQVNGVIDPWNFEKLVGGDYFVPSATLFVMMEYHIVDFFEVIRSNAMNSLVFMHYPQLSEEISSKLMVDATRNEGYAYYILNEGYHAMGLMGFFYNAVVITIGFWYWRRFTKTTNQGVNHVMTAVIATEFLSIVRAPTFYFVKDSYLVLAPAMFLVMLYAESHSEPRPPLLWHPGLPVPRRRQARV